jgi:CheY-like chemotaxis protein
MARNDDTTSSLAGIHVLVVEDHDDSRDLWERVLHYAGALVTAARTARQALELCASVHPDVVVTDLSMPEEDGIWLAEEIRARGERMPLIAVSGYSLVFGARLRAAPFAQVLQKPGAWWRPSRPSCASVDSPRQGLRLSWLMPSGRPVGGRKDLQCLQPTGAVMQVLTEHAVQQFVDEARSHAEDAHRFSETARARADTLRLQAFRAAARSRRLIDAFALSGLGKPA